MNPNQREHIREELEQQLTCDQALALYASIDAFVLDLEIGLARSNNLVAIADSTFPRSRVREELEVAIAALDDAHAAVNEILSALADRCRQSSPLSEPPPWLTECMSVRLGTSIALLHSCSNMSDLFPRTSPLAGHPQPNLKRLIGDGIDIGVQAEAEMLSGAARAGGRL